MDLLYLLSYKLAFRKTNSDWNFFWLVDLVIEEPILMIKNRYEEHVASTFVQQSENRQKESNMHYKPNIVLHTNTQLELSL